MSRRKSPEKAENTERRAVGGKGAALIITAMLLAAGLGTAAYFLMNREPTGSVDYENSNSGTGGSGVNQNTIALMNVKSADGSISGVIKIELYPDKAPDTVQNFIRYAKDGFYNGLVFHRVMANFVVQGGGFYYNNNVLTYKNTTYPPIKDEASNRLSNLERTIAMARTQDPNSATSQFYFNLKNNSDLDYSAKNPGYCVFGKVVDGWNLVQAMGNTPTHDESAQFPQGTQTMSNVPTVHLTIVSVTIQGA